MRPPTRRLALSLGFLLVGLTACETGGPAAEEKTPPAAVPANAAPDGPTAPEAPEAEDGTDDTGAPTAEAPPTPEEPPPPSGPRTIDEKVKKGESLSRILRRHGVDNKRIHALTVAMEPHFDASKIKIGMRYKVDIDEAEQVAAFELFVRAERSVRAIAGEPDTEQAPWTVEMVDAPVEVVEVAFGGTIDKSLTASVKAAGQEAALVAVLVDAFAYDIDFFTATRKGDTFRVVAERVELEGEFLRYGRILAAEYDGKAVGTHRLFWWEKRDADGTGGHYDEEGRGIKKSFLKSPLKFTRISSGFDRKRMHPVLHREKGHMGTDYAAPTGTPVWAAADGKIVTRGDKGGAGNMVVIKHEGGLRTLYMHLSRFADGQKVGTRVAQKTVIGYVGATGLATGPHLHFGVQRNGRYVDPQTVDSRRAAGVPKKHRKAFSKHARDLASQLDAIAVDGGDDPSPDTEDAAAPE